MHTHALNTALTLYHSGTLSLSQAALRAGCSEHEMARSLGRRGIVIRESLAAHASSDHPSVRAD